MAAFDVVAGGGHQPDPEPVGLRLGPPHPLAHSCRRRAPIPPLGTPCSSSRVGWRRMLCDISWPSTTASSSSPRRKSSIDVVITTVRPLAKALIWPDRASRTRPRQPGTESRSSSDLAARAQQAKLGRARRGALPRAGPRSLDRACAICRDSRSAAIAAPDGEGLAVHREQDVAGDQPGARGGRVRRAPSGFRGRGRARSAGSS